MVRKGIALFGVPPIIEKEIRPKKCSAGEKKLIEKHGWKKKYKGAARRWEKNAYHA